MSSTEPTPSSRWWRRRPLTITMVLIAAVWAGLNVPAILHHGVVDPGQPIMVRGQIRQFNGPLLGIAARCQNVLSLANEPLAVYDQERRLVAETWVQHVVRTDSHYHKLWTCRQEGDFMLRLPSASAYRFELGSLSVQPHAVSASALRARSGTYSMGFSVLDPDGDKAVACLSRFAAACPW